MVATLLYLLSLACRLSLNAAQIQIRPVDANGNFIGQPVNQNKNFLNTNQQQQNQFSNQLQEPLHFTTDRADGRKVWVQLSDNSLANQIRRIQFRGTQEPTWQQLGTEYPANQFTYVFTKPQGICADYAFRTEFRDSRPAVDQLLPAPKPELNFQSIPKLEQLFAEQGSSMGTNGVVVSGPQREMKTILAAVNFGQSLDFWTPITGAVLTGLVPWIKMLRCQRVFGIGIQPPPPLIKDGGKTIEFQLEHAAHNCTFQFGLRFLIKVGGSALQNQLSLSTNQFLNQQSNQFKVVPVVNQFNQQPIVQFSPGQVISSSSNHFSPVSNNQFIGGLNQNQFQNQFGAVNQFSGQTCQRQEETGFEDSLFINVNCENVVGLTSCRPEYSNSLTGGLSQFTNNGGSSFDNNPCIISCDPQSVKDQGSTDINGREVLNIQWDFANPGVRPAQFSVRYAEATWTDQIVVLNEKNVREVRKNGAFNSFQIVPPPLRSQNYTIQVCALRTETCITPINWTNKPKFPVEFRTKNDPIRRKDETPIDAPIIRPEPYPYYSTASTNRALYVGTVGFCLLVSVSRST